MRPQQQKRLAEFSGQTLSGHIFSSAKGSRYLTFVHDEETAPEYFPASHCERQRGGGGKESITGKRHARGPRLAARRQCASQRRTQERAESPPRVTLYLSLSLSLSLFLSLNPEAIPAPLLPPTRQYKGPTRQVGQRGARRSGSERGRPGSQARHCESIER